ncbi:MAG TPA: hypothetical protein PKM01_12440 [Anaerolineaceae bacterium]|nr:hypothetical protein [Anaerolineaceae bacterium]
MKRPILENQLAAIAQNNAAASAAKAPRTILKPLIEKTGQSVGTKEQRQ